MYSAVITSAGSGTRAGLGYNKMLFEIDGQTLVEKTVKTFVNNPNFDEVIVTVSDDDFSIYEKILKTYDVKLVLGGKERMHSVANGINVAQNEKVFVHDGARIFLGDELISRLVNHEPDCDGVALALKVVDTTLYVEGNKITKVLNRDNLYNMQTPQVVRKSVYNKCYETAIEQSLLFTDEMSMLTHFGYECNIVEGESYNKKMTRPEDFEV